MVYLDNGATGGFKPQRVMEEVIWGLKNSANPSRSGHKRAMDMAGKAFELRSLICKLFSFSNPERVIFTKNCTESLNLAIFGCVKKGGHVITTAYEHNSILRPLTHLKSMGLIELTILEKERNAPISKEQIRRAIKPNTYMVAMAHASNVTGEVTQIEQIGEMLNTTDIIFLVDGAQSGGYLNIDMKYIDMLALPAHKGLCSPMGLGFLIVNNKRSNLELSPLLYGGTGIQGESLDQPVTFPEAFEAGTLPALAICGGVGGVSYVVDNLAKIQQKMAYFNSLLYQTKLPKRIKVYSVPNKLGIFSFLINGYSSAEIAQVLDEKYNIAIRSGLTCAPLTHKGLGTLKSGLARASFSSFNAPQDVEYFFKCISKL